MTGRRFLHLVPQFHYDVEYLLPLEPYIEACFENLLEAHRLLSRHRDYTFLVEQAFLMEEFLREYPSLAADCRRAAAEGRFEMASGMYVMADQNMPSGESLVRQIVTGRAWCRRELGVEPRVFNAGDCTGAPASFPQMLRHGGYDFYVFMRAVDDPGRKAEALWRGIDGTEVKAYWLAAGYGGWVPPIFTTLPPAVGSRQGPDKAVATVLGHAAGVHALLPQGGDFVHPSESTPAAVERWNREHPDTPIAFSTYTRGLDAVDWSLAAPYADEWNPDRTGCYSSRIRIKQENRACEGLLRTAEAASVLAWQRLGIPLDRDGLLRAWKLTFLNQFHDTLWGTVCDEAHRAALRRCRRVRMVAQRLIETRLQAVLDGQAATPTGRCLVVFNPLPWPRTADVHLPQEGCALGFDLPSDPDFALGTTLRVALPACGYRVVQPAARPAGGAAAFSVTPRSDGGLDIETPLYRLRVAASGVIGSLARRSDGTEFVDLQRPWFNGLCLQSDRGDPWQYYEGPMSDGGPRGYASEIVTDPYPEGITLTRNGCRRIGWSMDNRSRPAERVEVAENSPERLVVQVHGAWHPYWPHFREFQVAGVDVRYVLRMTLWPDDPLIAFHLTTRHVLGRWLRLRAAFFTDLRQGRAIHEIAFGRFERPAGEFAAQNYMALVGPDKGLALLNRGLPGNNATDGVLLLSLMRSVNMDTRVGAESDMSLEDGTQHVFDYAVLPFGGERELDACGLARRGQEFACPPYVFERHPDRLAADAPRGLPAADGILDVEPGNVVCTAFYPADDGLVARLYESEGRPTRASVLPRFPRAAAFETDAMLRGRRPLPGGDAIQVTLKPFEIKTLLIEPAATP